MVRCWNCCWSIYVAIALALVIGQLRIVCREAHGEHVQFPALTAGVAEKSVRGQIRRGQCRGPWSRTWGCHTVTPSCVCGISTAYYAALRVRRGVRAALCAERRAGLDGRVGPGAEGGRFLPQHLTCLLGRPGVAPREGTGLLANGLFF